MALYPAARPQVLFLHAGWAREYRGANDDPPLGKFGYIKAGNEDAGEALNFRVFSGRCFGYAPHQAINLDRLGGNRNDEHVDGVLVVWTATDPAQGGRYIVGWYRNARVHSRMQKLRPDNYRPHAIVDAASADCHLVPVDQRTFFIPRGVTGWPGIAGAFFATENLSARDLGKVLAYVEGTSSPGFYTADAATWPASKPRGGWPTQDPELRAKVEKVAVELVVAHYQTEGWDVRSVEKENFGWDLDVQNSGRVLRVEVKGRGGDGAVELTPNEFDAMQRNATRMSYRVAIVHNALSASPTLTIFEYAPKSDIWVSTGGATLKLKKMIGAIVSINPA